MMPRTWSTQTLGSVSDLAWGDTSKTKAQYVAEGFQAFSATGPDGYLPTFDYDKEGVVVSAIGAQCGKTWLAKGKWSCIKNTIRIFGTPGICDTKFLYYVTLSRNIFTPRGSAQPFISQGDARNIQIKVPPLEEQLKISEVLGSIDDLITANESQIEYLDQLAMSYFLKKWDGVSTVRIDALGEVLMGQSPAGSTLNESNNGMVFYQGVRDFGDRYPSRRVFCTSPTRQALEGDILIAVRAPVGDTNVAIESTAIGRGIASLRAKLPAIALRSLRAAENTWAPYQDTGTVFSSITGPDLRGAKVPYVSNEELEALLSRLDKLHHALFVENTELAKTRDELLPLLMSGALNVKDAAA